MIRSAFRNYFKNFKSVFMAMGLIYFVIILVIFGFVSQIADILQSVSAQTYERLREYLQTTLSDLTVKEMFQSSFYTGFFNDVKAILQTDISHGGELIKATLALDLAAILGAATLAQQLCRTVMRHNIAGEKSMRGIVAIAVRYAISLGFGFLAASLGSEHAYHAIFVIIAYLLLKAFENLFAAWVIHFRQYALRGILRLSNSLRLLLSEFALMIFDAVVVVLVGVLSDSLIAILIGLPLFAYTFAVMDITAVDHFRELHEKGKLTLRSDAAQLRRHKKEEKLQRKIALEQILSAERNANHRERTNTTLPCDDAATSEAGDRKGSDDVSAVDRDDSSAT